MPISHDQFMKGEKGKKVAKSGVGSKIVASMRDRQGYSVAELAKLGGVEPKDLKNVLNYLEYTQGRIEHRIINGEKFFERVENPVARAKKK